MCFFRKNWPHVKIIPKLHIVEKHIVDFIAKWSNSVWLLWGKGAESLYNEFNKLNQT